MWDRLDLNQRHPHFQRGALPTELRTHRNSWRGRRDSNPRWSPRQGGALAAMLLPHEFGIAYGNRTRLFGLKDRGSHQKSNAICLARVVRIELTCTGFKAQTDVHVIPHLFGNGCGTRTHVLVTQNHAALPVKLPRNCCLVPAEGIEPSTYALSRRCSTTELSRHVLVPRDGIEPSFSPYQDGVLPLNYPGICLESRGGIEPQPRGRHLERVRTVTSSQHATYSWWGRTDSNRGLKGKSLLRFQLRHNPISFSNALHH